MEDLIKIPNDEFLQKLEYIRKVTQEVAQKRRRKKTPKSFIKMRPVSDAKEVPVVERAHYQKWLDDNFPGWSTDNFRAWETMATLSNSDGTTQQTPILFNVAFSLHVVESTGIKRVIPCIGTAPVSRKELSRETSQLLSQKYNIAMTAAFKSGCSWLGAFFDLRIDEEMAEQMSQPTNDSQNKHFKELLQDVPEEYRLDVENQWKTQNLYSAEGYLSALKQKIDNLKSNNNNNNNNKD